MESHSLFAEHADRLAPALTGQIEGLHTAPLFIAKDAAGLTTGQHRWNDGSQLSHACAVAYLASFLETYGDRFALRAVGHRVVHGGVDYSDPVRIDDEVLAKLEKLIPLAPLHQPHNLAPIRNVAARLSELTQVACFRHGVPPPPG